MMRRICCLSLLASGAFTETVVVKPSRYYETFAAHEPVARIRPGDSVVTKLLDSRGRDETGRLVLDGDNVLTGPFYIEGAEPGDTLMIKLDLVRLNRDWGWNGVRISTDALAPSHIEGLESPICCEEWLQPKRRNALKWILEPPHGMMRPSQPLGNQVKLEFPAHPSVGCVGVAPPLKQAISSGPMGRHGGNLDYNGMEEGAVVHLPVFERGAYFLLGDGHAGFGDGELIGQGTETSLDVRFTVNLRKRHSVSWPRVERADSIVTLGATPGALERGFREAISEMLAWLQTDYGLSQREAHTLVHMTAQLRVASWFGTSACEIPRKYLPAR